MDFILIILGLNCCIIGLLGSFLPVLPGPPISWLGLLLLYLTKVVEANYWILGIYFHSSKPNLVGQIYKPSRDYENTISIDYLSRLNERYEAWITGYNKGKLLIIDVDNVDFVNNPEDLGMIINRIDAEINGLF